MDARAGLSPSLTRVRVPSTQTGSHFAVTIHRVPERIGDVQS